MSANPGIRILLVWGVVFAGLIPRSGAGETNDLDIVVTREFVLDLFSRVPKEFSVTSKIKIPLRQKLDLPDQVFAEQPLRRFMDESPDDYKSRMKLNHTPTPREICLYSKQVNQINHQLAEAAEATKKATGTRLSVRVNGVIKSAEATADELKNKSTALVIFPGDHWRMLTEPTQTSRGLVPPKVDLNQIGFRKISLKIPSLDRPPLKTSELDLGEVVIAWNKQGIKEELADSRVAGTVKLAALLDDLTGHDKSPQTALANFVVTQAARGTLKKVDQALLKNVFCSDADRPGTGRLHASREKRETPALVTGEPMSDPLVHREDAKKDDGNRNPGGGGD